jgi:hypothetical protein
MHDPMGILFPHLTTITPVLKKLFGAAFVSVTAVTARLYPERVAWLGTDDFFQVTLHDRDLQVGEDFRILYDMAAATCAPQQPLHLGFIDRVAFALQTDHRQAFTRDISALSANDLPLVFHRSPVAWETHPATYRVLEGAVSTAGQALLGCTLDFAWCYLALTAAQLHAALAGVTRPDISMVAEMLLPLRHDIGTRDVDWLAWEDPFILGRDAEELRRERELSAADARKRLGYVIPMLQILEAAAANGTVG